MKCDSVRMIFQDYLERRLSILDRNEVIRHVGVCRRCEKELAYYRDMFAYLGEMRSPVVPRGFRNSVISRLKSGGVIHSPHRGRVGSQLDRFLALPASARYPLAALATVAALYAPVVLALRRIEGAAADAALLVGRFCFVVRDAIAGVEVISRGGNAVSGYGRAARTVGNAVVSTLASIASSEQGVLAVAAVVVAVGAATIGGVFIARRKGSHHASI